MGNKRLKNLYNEVFISLYPKIKNQKRGVLHNLIYILLDPNQSQANAIYQKIGIKENDYREDDKKLVNELMDNPEENIINNLNPLTDNNKMELLWIVVIACSLVGTYACIQFLKRNQEQKRKQKQAYEKAQTTQSDTLPQKSLTAALCLIVPASIVSHLKNYLDPNDVEQLLDNASYFLCTTVDDADLKQERLELTTEDIPVVGNQEIYIRIHIPDGQEMINKKILYILKRNLPSHGQGIVKTRASLRNLSGLEVFNRI